MLYPDAQGLMKTVISAEQSSSVFSPVQQTAAHEPLFVVRTDSTGRMTLYYLFVDELSSKCIIK